MNKAPFDNLMRTLTKSRRWLLGGALATLTGLPVGVSTDAKKKRKRKGRKQKATPPNAFGCIDVGDLCQNGSQCCSSICAGKKGKRTCRAHDVGDCHAGAEPATCGVTDIACSTSSGQPGACATTTGNAGYCMVDRQCYACATDLQCQRAGGGMFGPRAACIQCAVCGATYGTACASPDGLPMFQEESNDPLA